MNTGELPARSLLSQPHGGAASGREPPQDGRQAHRRDLRVADAGRPGRVRDRPRKQGRQGDRRGQGHH